MLQPIYGPTSGELRDRAAAALSSDEDNESPRHRRRPHDDIIRENHEIDKLNTVMTRRLPRILRECGLSEDI